MQLLMCQKQQKNHKPLSARRRPDVSLLRGVSCVQCYIARCMLPYTTYAC